MRVAPWAGPAASLRAKLLVWLMPPMLAVFTASIALSYDVALQLANDAYDAGLLDSVDDFAKQIRFEGGKPTLVLTAQAHQILTSDPADTTFFRVIAHSGETVAGNDYLPPPRGSLRRHDEVAYYNTDVRGEPVRAAAVAVESPDGAAFASVVVAETLHKRAALQRRLVAVVLLSELALIVAASAIIWFGVTRGLRPLHELAQAVARRGWTDLTTLAAGRSPREVRPLVESINDLMRRLSIALEGQQRFIANAAHQLRTPLAGLIAQTELAVAESEPQAHRAALKQLHAASRRAVRLVNQLLTLARSEPGNEPSARFAPVDLARLAEEVTMQWVPEAIAADVDLGYGSEGRAAIVQGDELLLGEMLGNLIDNAVRYGKHPGTVTVSLSCGQQPELAVLDDGPGIPEQELPRVFERFHRVPGSLQGGAGLGLAIVREIAHAHGAVAEVRRANLAGGTLVTVRFPRQVG